MMASTEEEIKPDAGDLLIFGDDTGHETFAGDQAFYGLGCCLVLGEHYEHLKSRWRDVRKIIKGDPDAPLHASDITVSAKPEDFVALGDVFKDPCFARVAVTTTKSVALPALMEPCEPVMGLLEDQIRAIAGLLPCKRIWIVLEASKRADSTVMRCFGRLASLGPVSSSPAEHRFLPKSANEPGLEVADFIVSAAGTRVRHRMRGKSGEPPDFSQVFRQLPRIGCRYREATKVTHHPDGTISIDSISPL
ncbi:MAG: hypothetical protein WAU78_12970 [Roseiarcus sp.]